MTVQDIVPDLCCGDIVVLKKDEYGAKAPVLAGTDDPDGLRSYEVVEFLESHGLVQLKGVPGLVPLANIMPL